MDFLDSSDGKKEPRDVKQLLHTDGQQQFELRSSQHPLHDWSPRLSSSHLSRPVGGDSNEDDNNGENLAPSVNASCSLVPMCASACNASSSFPINVGSSYSTFDSTTCCSWATPSSPASTASSSVMPPSASNSESNAGICMPARPMCVTCAGSSQSTTTTATNPSAGGALTGITRTTSRPVQQSRMDRIRKQLLLCMGSSNESEEGKEDGPCAPVVAKRRPLRSTFVRVLFGVVAAATIAAALLLDCRSVPSDPPPPLENRMDRSEGRRELEWVWDRNVYRPPPNHGEHPFRQPQRPNRSPVEESDVASPLKSLPPPAQAQGRTEVRPDSREDGGDRRTQRHRRRRNLLIVQVGRMDGESHPRKVPVSSLSSPPSSALWLDISSRPNRAYAKQWGMDYVMIHTPPSPAMQASSSPPPTAERRPWSWPWHRRRDGAQATDASSRASARDRDQFGLDLISVVQSVLDRQEGSNRQDEEADGGTHDDAQHQQQMEEPDVTYDALILIPNNAVILDLDYDLLRLIPEDVLASLSRKNQDSGEKAHEEVGYVYALDLMNVEGSDADADADLTMDLTETVVLFNLQHQYARSMVREWSDLALTRRRCDTSSELGSASHEPAHDGANGQARNGCGQPGDARLLLQAIQNAGGNDDGASSLVLNLTETGDGFVGRSDDNPHAIKAITLNPSFSVSSAFESNKTGLSTSGIPPSATMDAAFSLQTAADSVCYRFYPKCEVL